MTGSSPSHVHSPKLARVPRRRKAAAGETDLKCIALIVVLGEGGSD